MTHTTEFKPVSSNSLWSSGENDVGAVQKELAERKVKAIKSIQDEINQKGLPEVLYDIIQRFK